MKENLKVGLIGLGNMGRNHMRVLSMLKGVDLVFVYDVNQEATKRLAAQCGARALSDLDEALGDVDAVIIASPTVTHADYILRVAGKVKNIFVEKPLAQNLAETQRVAEFAEKEKLNIQVGFIERFNPAVQGLKNILAKSTRVISVEWLEL